MKLSSLTIAVCASLLFVSPVFAQEAISSAEQVAVTPDTAADTEKEYTMRPGDQLNIVVTQQPEIGNNATNTAPFIVRPDGRVSFPLVGEIHVTGMTVAEFTEVLRMGLSQYIIQPDVSVNIVQLGGVRVYVFGEVARPGAYELTKENRIIDAIGAAGSFTWDTAKKKIFLIHPAQKDKPIAINLNKMLQTGDMTENYEMHEGDILYLTKNDRLVFSRDIAPIFNSIYMMHEATKN